MLLFDGKITKCKNCGREAAVAVHKPGPRVEMLGRECDLYMTSSTDKLYAVKCGRDRQGGKEGCGYQGPHAYSALLAAKKWNGEKWITTED